MQFLQMIFLPATFVAAIVSMNFFDLTTSPPKVSSYIWIFWVVALGLTVLVLGIYFFWKWRKKEEAREEEQRAKRKENLRGWEEGGIAADDEDGDLSGSDLAAGGRKRRRRRRRRKGAGNGSGSAAEEGKGKEKPELVL